MLWFRSIYPWSQIVLYGHKNLFLYWYYNLKIVVSDRIQIREFSVSESKKMIRIVFTTASLPSKQFDQGKNCLFLPLYKVITKWGLLQTLSSFYTM